ncbi:BCCT family transporter [Pseudonocardia tropica]|uniref:BCCT family transporter n=1 Tax=Pseudonocardia tropica TaxID=681289 RepID=A0ABV1JX00_9PSEU
MIEYLARARVAGARFGRITLGGDDDEPEFRTVSWTAMTVSAARASG